MEHTALQRGESEVRAQLASSKDECARANEELISIQASAGGSAAKLEELTRAHKEEKQLRKDAEQRIARMQEDLNETQSAVTSTEKKLETLKKKQLDERERFEAENDELKGQHESSMEALRRKSRKEKQSFDADLVRTTCICQLTLCASSQGMPVSSVRVLHDHFWLIGWQA